MKSNAPTCVILIKQDLFYKIRPYLDDTIKVLIKQQIDELIHTIRTQGVHCGILFCEKPNQFNQQQIIQFKQRFPKVPLLSILSNKCIDTAHNHGRAGIEKTIHISNIDQLNNEVSQLINQYSVKISLKDIGISKLNYSQKLNEALKILEENYINLMGVKEIANLLEINESTLSREFKKYDLPGPKRILMYLKVHHAMKLKESNGLNRRELAILSGFSSERRLTECIQRITSKNKKQVKKEDNRSFYYKKIHYND